MSDTLKAKIAELARNHGQRGMRLLVLFEIIKPLAKEQLSKMKISLDEDELNQVCIEKADELTLSEDSVTPKHIKELVETIRTRTLKRYRTQDQMNR